MRVDLISVFWHNLEGEKHNEPILACSFDPSSSSSSSKRLATAGGDKTIKIWDVLEIVDKLPVVSDDDERKRTREKQK